MDGLVGLNTRIQRSTALGEPIPSHTHSSSLSRQRSQGFPYFARRGNRDYFHAIPDKPDSLAGRWLITYQVRLISIT